ncbi:acyltransferase [Methylobacterium sp. NEAU K]|uniref:acyltransferase family protein n=1 Tax=Methylobacterium sp. NEAU K TaxID=3064946 RepID=UPI00273482D9|nr:acyltransferase [Methylobacterium sp. NEAU K]MDP4004377.1 acyltransferase [Methylobacterium sp. NEAU K]
MDGLRGVAAIGVMLFHFSIIGVPIARHGYLAVDFFFILSGFVMAHAYSHRLETMPISRFLKLRIIRIYPLVVIGLSLGTSYFLLRYFSNNQSLYGVCDIIFGSMFNIFLLPKPWMSSAPTDTIFTTNTPLWSLSLEMALNILWARFFYKSPSRRLLIFAAVSGASMGLFSFQNGSADLGATWPTYPGGAARAVFGFFAGVLLWRYRPEPNKKGLHPEISALLLFAVLFVPDIGAAFDIFVIVFVFPSIIYIAACADFREERFIFKLSGNLSYPLYVIHVPMLHFFVGFSKTFKLGDHSTLVAALAAILCMATAVLLDYFYDRPVRRFLARAWIS